MSFLFSKLAEKYKSIKVINVFSDGAASQFKQHYLFPNLHKWENEFSMKLIWNFFATSHGKGAVDGIGGTVKRSVWRVVGAGTTAPLDAASYAEIGSKRHPNINVEYISSAEIEKDLVKKAPIWSASVGAPTTLNMHCVRAHNAKMLRVSAVSLKMTSNWWKFFKVLVLMKVSLRNKTNQVMKIKRPLKLISVTGF